MSELKQNSIIWTIIFIAWLIALYSAWNKLFYK